MDCRLNAWIDEGLCDDWARGASSSAEVVEIAERGARSFVGPVVVRVCRGTVWVTRENDAVDHIIRAGQALSLGGRGRAVVQALGGAARIIAKAAPSQP